MFDEGLLEEARGVYPYKELNALQTVGYAELFDHFDGRHDLDEAKRLIKRNSRRYAKKQLTWLRKEEGLIWLNSVSGVLGMIDELINVLHK